MKAIGGNAGGFFAFLSGKAVLKPTEDHNNRNVLSADVRICINRIKDSLKC